MADIVPFPVERIERKPVQNDNRTNLYWGIPHSKISRQGDDTGLEDEFYIPSGRVQYRVIRLYSYSSLYSALEDAKGGLNYRPDIVVVDEHFKLYDEDADTKPDVKAKAQEAIKAIKNRFENPHQFIKDLFDSINQQSKELHEIVLSINPNGKIILVSNSLSNVDKAIKTQYLDEYIRLLNQLTQKHPSIAVVEAFSFNPPFNVGYIDESILGIEKILGIR